MKKGIRKELKSFDRLKADYFDRKIFQLTLDYFLRLEGILRGSTINAKEPSTTFISQLNLSPAVRLKCDIAHAGTVVRIESDLVEENCNVVSVNQSPRRDMELILFNPTYFPTKRFKYPQINIGMRIGRKVIRMTVHNPRQLRALAILSSGKEAIKRIDRDHYQVRSQHGDFYYDVVFKKRKGWLCS